ncbi:hypothetical protein [Paenibacillus xylanilyticus]|uniref:Uncharacterized protein n=1 Tax=Paenibacillus xylanilyticus TaxID=248903 RepID=A0A7Y6ESU8_9BACL|nr:hypothetical protein [Paenibacillus xylanilyticus]NUU75322.1 hypothetical protein [Paenibacillus xylanilyticus]
MNRERIQEATKTQSLNKEGERSILAVAKEVAAASADRDEQPKVQEKSNVIDVPKSKSTPELER